MCLEAKRKGHGERSALETGKGVEEVKRGLG